MAVQIPLTRGLVALVDDEDAWVGQYKWHAHPGSRTWYALRAAPRPGPRTVRMHTLLTGFRLVDHRNGNGLDNRRSNLREATHAENLHNMRKCRGSSQYKGVGWDSVNGRWQAQIGVDRRQIWLGRFLDEIEAARAYDEAARVHYGEFAALNFPRPGERSAR